MGQLPCTPKQISDGFADVMLLRWLPDRLRCVLLGARSHELILRSHDALCCRDVAQSHDRLRFIAQVRFWQVVWRWCDGLRLWHEHMLIIELLQLGALDDNDRSRHPH